LTLFALSEFWSAVYTAGGFWVAIIGLVIAFLGFGYTIHQVRKTKSAAEAAQEAAESALHEAKQTFRGFVVLHANRIVSELNGLIEAGKWESAALRADDLAEMVTYLREEPGWSNEYVDALRDSAANLRKKAKKESARFATTNWDALRKRLHAFLDRAKAPY
jgi:hypothetical protein